MPYYLAIERNPDSYEAVNIKTTKNGKKIFQHDNAYECTLSEIDKFTTECTSINALSAMLYEDKKVPWSNCSLALVNVNGKEIKITQDFLFSSSKKYLDNPSLVINYITNKFLNFDIPFTLDLVQFVSCSNTKSVLMDLVNTMNNCISYNMPLEVSNVIKIAESLIYNKDEDIVNYEKLHNIVVYIANYENKKLMENAKNKSKVKTKNT